LSAASRPFTKTAPAAALHMFEAEAAGLLEIASSNTIRVPEVYDVGIRDGSAYIEMERLQLRATTAEDETAAGEQLAAMHRVTAERFGWYRDNTIGPTPQHNPASDSWLDFYGAERLQYQFRLAAQNGYDGELQAAGARLLNSLPALLGEHRPVPSLLHGDLWGGNWGATDAGVVTFDPAVYYGDRETDIAMTRLFGGFGRNFYAAYERAWPLPAGHERRVALYQLYHVLNHLNLFGSGYLGQSLALLKQLF
jgi:fructosamine-3-kinase